MRGFFSFLFFFLSFLFSASALCRLLGHARQQDASVDGTASNNKNNNNSARSDWLQNHTDVFYAVAAAVVVAFFWGCAKFAEAGLMNEKPATTTRTATTAERHKADTKKKNVSFRVALVWSVQKNRNEKNSYFCSTLKRAAQSTTQSCDGFFAVCRCSVLFTVALCSFCCSCCIVVALALVAVSSSRQVYLHFYCSSITAFPICSIFIALSRNAHSL